MKKQVLKCFIGGSVLTILIIIMATLEGEFREIRMSDEIVIAFIAVLATASFALLILSSAYEYHRSIKHNGWKRILIILSVLFMPLGLYIGYEVMYANSILQHILVASTSIGSTYIAVILTYFVVVFLFRWVNNGFIKDTYSE